MSTTPPRTAVALLCALAAWSLAIPSRADEGNTRALLKLGVELDSNPRRELAPTGDAEPATRAFARVEIDRNLGPLGALEARLLLGAKAHLESSDEDALVSDAALSHSVALYAAESWALALYARGELSDRSERLSTRDYTRAAASAGLALRTELGNLSAGGGYHGFLYKPDFDGNHAGPTFQAALAVPLWDDLWLRASYVWLDRRFDVARFVEDELLVLLDPSVTRHDWLHALRAGLGYEGDFLLSAAYSLQVNRSNSFGPGLLRHGVELAWTQPLPFDLLLATTLRLQRTLYDDPVRIDETLRIDDSDRNEWNLSLSLPLADGLAVEARYSLFTEALSESGEYIRHLGYVGLSFDAATGE